MKKRPGSQPLDKMIGRRIRLLRLSRGLSQRDLAGRVGTTFQQVHKYERGTNRISAKELHEIAVALNVGLACFFEDAGMAENLAADLEPPAPVDLMIVRALGMLPAGQSKERFEALIFSLAKTKD